jgi:hypothetical protein
MISVNLPSNTTPIFDIFALLVIFTNRMVMAQLRVRSDIYCMFEVWCSPVPVAICELAILYCLYHKSVSRPASNEILHYNYNNYYCY